MNVSRTKKKGILLAGGAGSRLNPATIAVNKHLLPIHDKPLIYYSMSSLLLCNVEEVAIVCRPQDIDKFKLLFGDGSHLGITVQYFSQPDFDGIPGLYGSSDPIDRRNIGSFFLKCSKPLVPEDKDLSVVFVQVFRINRMVNPMMGWSDDDFL